MFNIITNDFDLLNYLLILNLRIFIINIKHEILVILY